MATVQSPVQAIFLISGAGIAGNALAFWLVRLGHDVTIIERFPNLRATGLQLDLRGHGIDVLKKMGLEEAFKARSPPERGVQIVNNSVTRRASFPAKKSGKGLQSFTTEYEIMRQTSASCSMRQRRIMRVNLDKNVQISFEDGRNETFDLIVGADGVTSRTRALMGKDGFHPCQGQFAAYMTLQSPIAENEMYDATMYIGRSRGLMVRRHSPDQLQIYLFCRADSTDLVNAKRGSEQEKAAFASKMRGTGWKADAFLDRLDEMPDFYCERLGLVKLDSWSSGRVGLVRDAGYCLSSNTGMGSTSAVVGAYILAGEVSTHGDDVKSAMDAYERKFRPFMDQVQAGVLEGSGSFPSSALGVALLNITLSLASFFRVDVFGKYILKEDVKNWDLPEYEALKA